jgi:O-antigen/teichoic acid export membrane protein
MYTAQYLGAEGFGTISLALSLTGIFVILADMGLGSLMIREIAQDKSLTDKYISNILLMKILLTFLMIGAIALTVNLKGDSELVKIVIYLITLSTIVNVFNGVFISIFQANEKVEYLAINIILNSVLMITGTIIGITYQLNILYFASIYIIANIIGLVYSINVYVWKFSLPKIDIDLNFWKPTLLEAWPFGFTALFATIYFYIDSVILSFMVNNEVVGWYNAAYRLIIVLLFIPTVLNVVIFPVMSQLYKSSKDSLKFAYEKYFQYMVMIGIPIGVGVTLLANKIILLIFGAAYTNSIIALQILVWAAVIIFISGAFARLLEASNKQLTLTKITAICAVINIVLNLLLIPKFTYIAASATTVLTELLAFLMGMKVVSNMGYAPSKKEYAYIIKSIFASLIMGIFIVYLNHLNLFILIIIGIIVYFTTIFIIKGFDEEDLNLLKVLLGKTES